MQTDGVFDETVAATYDDLHIGDAAAVECLADLAGDGPALEFAIGTGRIALPLSGIGIAVQGVELSRAMVAQLRKKETGPPLEIAIGDMASTVVPGEFSLVYLVFNTIDNLTSQDAQIACFKNAYAHLKPGGRFVVETLVPPVQKLPFGETRLANECGPAHWNVDEFDVVTQQYVSHHIYKAPDGFAELSVPFRYAWPAEFDVMAKLAGLRLEHRWAGWDRAEFTNVSKSHVSVWRRPEA